MSEAYHEKVELLIKALPLVAQENDFALHGGTAINLFVRNMSRLSVDIDLTYVPVEDRQTSIHKINEALKHIKKGIEQKISGSRVIHREDTAKLMIQAQRAEIKLEVNLVGRGTISAPVKMAICEKVQSDFESFVGLVSRDPPTKSR